MTTQDNGARKLEFNDSGLANKLFGPQGANLDILA